MMGWETLYLNTTLNLMPTKYSVQPDGPTCTGDETSTETGSGDTETDAKKEKKEKKKETASDNMNIRGVFLHVLADALGSIVVIISAGVILGTDPPSDPEVEITLASRLRAAKTRLISSVTFGSSDNFSHISPL